MDEIGLAGGGRTGIACQMAAGVVNERVSLDGVRNCGLEETFVQSGFMQGRLHASRVDGFPRLQRDIIKAENVEKSEVDDFHVVIRLVECRWLGDDAAKTLAPSQSGDDRGSGQGTPRRMRSKTDRFRARLKECNPNPELKTELNLYTDEITMGYFCRFAMQTLAVELTNKPQRRQVLNSFRSRIQPLWELWMNRKLSKQRFITHVCAMYAREVPGSENSGLINLFSSWYFAFCRSRRRLERLDSALNLIDPTA